MSGSEHNLRHPSDGNPKEGTTRHKYTPQILIDAGNNLKLTRMNQRISLSVFPGLLCVPSIARDKTHGDRTCRNALQKKRVK